MEAWTAFWMAYWLLTWNWIMPGVTGLGVLYALYHIYEGLKFEYYYYVETGEFLVFPPDNQTNAQTRRRNVAEKYQLDHDGPWLMTLLGVFVILIVAFVGSLVWPITSLLVFPMLATWTISHRARKKKVFIDKLQGNKVVE